MKTNNPLQICLWFDNQAEEAVNFYSSLFPNSKIGKIARYTSEGKEIHGQDEGKVMTIDFELNGMKFIALNGGPIFKFNESMSICVMCDTQEEIDYYWSELTKEGAESYCGWLKDKFGVSWQIAPNVLSNMLSDENPRKVQTVTAAFMQVRKFVIADLWTAFNSVK
ncbi:MAG: hypothetical protein A2X64_09570 [Ignavibacteria bacterium GWF2_33_9]|nr:MAG: hypothetical protein A2X64_09570 [Ignavibacteria bacterium GWF2_33_9]